MECHICEINCTIKEKGVGQCGMYTCVNSEIRERYPDRYLAAVDTAIESMPMVHYHPRGIFLQVCTVGCNFKCQGCVSEILTDHFDAIEGQFQEMTPEQIIHNALSLNCIGVMFCFNEPTVSYFTFKRLARMAREKGLLVGCATNGYMTRWALEGLIPYLNFVNLGLKGVSEGAYGSCGITNIEPILRNIRLLHQKKIYFEISAIFRKHQEEELIKAGEFIASLSKTIPFQVMRFIPFGKATIDMEPSVRESEAVCDQLRSKLAHVYLFNTPGTDYLNSYCPECGATIMERGFFGPMCSNLYRYLPQGRCHCGFQLPIQGEIHDSQVRETGYFGGYRTINALKMVQSLLAVLGVTDKRQVDAVMLRVIKEAFIKELYERLNRIDAYFDTVDYFATLIDKKERAAAFRQYVGARVAHIREKTQAVKRPAVYATLGHPLIAMFTEKMESRLIEAAGGHLTNHLIERESRPGITILPATFRQMAPEIIIVSDGAAWPARDFISYCTRNDLDVPAVRSGNIFHLHPFRTSTNPDWILGLMALANIIHPALFHFDLQKEAELFYHTFYRTSFNGGNFHELPWQRRKIRSEPAIQ